MSPSTTKIKMLLLVTRDQLQKGNLLSLLNKKVHLKKPLKKNKLFIKNHKDSRLSIAHSLNLKKPHYLSLIKRQTLNPIKQQPLSPKNSRRRKKVQKNRKSSKIQKCSQNNLSSPLLKRKKSLTNSFQCRNSLLLRTMT